MFQKTEFHVSFYMFLGWVTESMGRSGGLDAHGLFVYRRASGAYSRTVDDSYRTARGAPRSAGSSCLGVAIQPIQHHKCWFNGISLLYVDFAIAYYLEQL